MFFLRCPTAKDTCSISGVGKTRTLGLQSRENHVTLSFVLTQLPQYTRHKIWRLRNAVHATTTSIAMGRGWDIHTGQCLPNIWTWGGDTISSVPHYLRSQVKSSLVNVPPIFGPGEGTLSRVSPHYLRSQVKSSLVNVPPIFGPGEGTVSRVSPRYLRSQVKSSLVNVSPIFGPREGTLSRVSPPPLFKE